MNIFADYHHGGAARSQVLLLQRRLGHRVYFPDPDMVLRCQPWMSQPGVWLPVVPGWLKKMGGVPSEYEDMKWGVSYDEFMSTPWDMILMTRLESEAIFRELLKLHPNGSRIKRVAMTGNEMLVPFDWEFVPNLMTTEYLSAFGVPKSVRVVHYSQELGMDYGKSFVPVTEASLRAVGSFINCWPTFTYLWVWPSETPQWGGRCPHCNNEGVGPREPVVPYKVWSDARELLPNHEFREYGIHCANGCIDEKYLPPLYHECSMTVHLKTYDGYGHSLLQSVAQGRPVVVPWRFHKYRTAGRYLVPNVTCFEADWTGESVAGIIRYVTENVGRANHYAEACYRAAQGLFQWEHEAYRVREFLGGLR